MKEETIQKVFSPRDWSEGFCAHCCEHGGCVSMADVPTCYGCLEKYYDEDGEALPPNVYQPNEPTIDELLSGTSRKAIASNVILGMTAAFISGALFMACLLMDQSEVAAYTAAVLGGVK